MKIPSTLLSIALVCFPIFLIAQISITGKVIDQKTKEPLPYVYIKVQDVALGTVTEGDGIFSIKLPKQYEDKLLEFSYLGYETFSESVKNLQRKDIVTIEMKTEATVLDEIVVVPKKLPKAKVILRRVLNNVEKNYSDFSTLIHGYYRETIKENGAYIKFTDAACSYYSAPYAKQNYKWKDYQSAYAHWSNSLSNIFDFTGSSLHRSHFHHETLKEEQMKIIDSRSSLNGSVRNMDANIQGGPLGLFGRDRLKYQKSFLGKKRMKDFTYLVDEVQDENGKWLYLLHFKTTTTKAQLDAAESPNPNNTKQWRLANKHKLLEGKIYIDQETYAVLKYECNVPNELKKYFCGFTTMATKHFDYKLEARYKKYGNKYFIEYLRHEDEFIYKDTTDDTTTPYAAISEFRNLKIQTNDIKPLSKVDNFTNSHYNQLHDYAVDFDSLFWVNYTSENPIASIDAEIRTDMEKEKTMEEQFRDKHLRDENMPAPIAEIKPLTIKLHGEKVTDNYAWLKDTKVPKSNKAVMDYIRAENDYTDNYFLPFRKAQRKIFSELAASVEKNYKSLPTKRNGYLYFLEYKGDQDHPSYYRSPIDKPDVKELLLDVNEMAKEKEFYNAGGIQASPNNQLIAFYENTTGKDAWVMKFKDLKSNNILTDSLTDVGGMVWIDENTLLYTQLEKKTYRSYRIRRHRLNTPQSNDELIYEERDPSFGVSLGKSKSKEFIFMNCGNSTSSEMWLLRSTNPYGKFQLIHPREKDHQYGFSHYKDKFYISSNKNSLNGKLLLCDTATVDFKHWKTLIPHRPEVMINDFTVFDNYLVISEKERAQDRIRIIDRRTKEEHFIKFKTDIYTINIGYNPDTNSDTLQFSFSSIKIPSTVFNYHMGTKEKRVVKKEKTMLMWTGKNIKVKRVWVPTDDGKKVPMTIVYNKWRDGGKKSRYNRVYMSSYGAYGSGQSVGYSQVIHSLMNRGFTVVIPHVRGGNDLGMPWYHDGKLLNKKNTFNDFIACAKYLIDEGYAEKGSITAQGGSAGGLLMGAIANMRPDLFKTIVLDVPFVDVINTMMDDKLPLTVDEYQEWGNPNKKKYYEYIKSYSPYENVKAQAYPNMLFFTGLNDTRVGYWEPAKMVAKLRTLKTDNNLLLLKTALNSGHSGGSGRYAYYKDLSYKLAIIFDLYEQDLKANLE